MIAAEYQACQSDQAQKNLLQIAVDLHEIHGVGNESDEQGTEQSRRDASFAAGEAHATRFPPRLSSDPVRSVSSMALVLGSVLIGALAFNRIVQGRRANV
ncbi:MAG: hypothetical protein EOQ96_15300 [Mesorhizobium sp.]|nr:MAG: hypothetical protein EOQ96_15300 [Mesorhizobium sp.]